MLILMFLTEPKLTKGADSLIGNQPYIFQSSKSFIGQQ